jgi:hypothetical protein
MFYTDLENEEGIGLFIDFQKAFDCVNRTFLIAALKHMNFGENVIKWIEILYTDIEACIINNGTTGKYFKLTRGVRQGCPLSPYLFVIIIEFLAAKIRSNNDINGFTIDNKVVKLTMYADDLTVFVKNEKAAKCLFTELHKFSRVTGLQVNLEKSEGLWLGSRKNSARKPFGIKWPDKPVKALGVYFSYDKKASDKLNFDDKIRKLERQLHWWKARDLSLAGKILIIKTKAISKFTYLASVLKIPKDVIKSVNNLLFNFIWNGKRDKVKRDIMIQNYELGGYKMPNMEMIICANQIECIKRFLMPIDADWKHPMRHFCKKENLDLFLQSNFDLNELPSIIPDYYHEAIKSWANIKHAEIESQQDFENELIWYNKRFKINNKTVYNKRIMNAGIWTLPDMYENGQLVTGKTLLERGVTKLDLLIWNGLINCIPHDIKNTAKTIRKTSQPINLAQIKMCDKIINIIECTQKDIKEKFKLKVYKKQHNMKAIEKHEQHFEKLDESDWHTIFTIPFIINCENKVKELHFKIIHRYFATYKFLHDINMVESSKCIFCGIYEETINHLFYSCLYVKSFWITLFNVWNNEQNDKIDITEIDIILGFGFKHDTLNKTVNLLILLGKRYITKCRYERSRLDIKAFFNYMKHTSPLFFIPSTKLKPWEVSTIAFVNKIIEI